MIPRFGWLGIIAVISGISFDSWGIASARIYVYEDRQGVRHFTNVPNHSGFTPLQSHETQGPRRARRPNAYEHLIREAAARHSIDAHLIRAVIRVESDFDSRAQSHKGAMGLMQLMPATAQLHNVVDILDPRENIEGGIKHLKLLMERFQGDLKLALAAYNAGMGAVERYGGIPPFRETRDYVQRVLHHYNAYRRNGF